MKVACTKHQCPGYACACKEAKIKLMTMALNYVLEKIDKSDRWWMDDPSRGGFDTDLISTALPKEKK
jgi:hypothetical protein